MATLVAGHILKENMMEYPEEIYWDNFVPGISPARQKTFLVERAYDMGKADAKSLDGYSNLTEAISAGDPIDWEKLDGLKAQCVQPGSGALSGKLVRDDSCPANSGSGWKVHGMGADYLIVTAWYGEDGWTLWIEGEIPMRRKTADQLEVGNYFRGVYSKKEWFMYVGGEPLGDIGTIYYAPEMLKSGIPASEWEVIEELGTFQGPEGE